MREFRQRNHTTPVVLMGYANPVERYDQKHGTPGTERLCARCSRSRCGWRAESWTTRPRNAKTFAADLRAHGMDLIFLLAPTSPTQRMPQVARVASGYVYYVSLKGVTGSGALDTGGCRTDAAPHSPARSHPGGRGLRHPRRSHRPGHWPRWPMP